MSIFSSSSPLERCGVIVDIGSGSVGIAIVISSKVTETFETIWSHREHMLIKDAANEHALLKDINTTLINAFLELGSSGMRTLHDHDSTVTPKYLQIAICAPWSYTVTKHIKFEDEHPFVVTTDIIESLVETAKKESSLNHTSTETMETLGISRITDATVSVALNGYLVKNPIGHTCRSIYLSHITALAQEKILHTLDELQSKIVPKTERFQYSFMYIYYQVLRHLHPDSTEMCLIDITNEATEIGIVRDDTLTHTTYAQIGLYSLAREIAATCNIPKEEAYNLIKNGSDFSSTYSESLKTKIEGIFLTYQEKIAKLFEETGDELSIPKTIFIHTSQNTEDFFSRQIKEAAKKATGMNHTIHLCTSELLKEGATNDTALALSTYFFHHKDSYLGFEYDL